MKTVNRNKGFTLVELIVVIAIVAVLASISIASYSQFIKNARNSTANNELNQVYNVIYIDAARPNVVGDDLISTDGGKIKFLFEDLSSVELEDHLTILLNKYVNEGFYQGQFNFTKNLLTYISRNGGKASREIVFDFGVEVNFTVKADGSLDVVVKNIS